MSDSHLLFLIRTFHTTIYIIVAVSVIFLLVSVLKPVYTRLMHLFGEAVGILLKTCYTSSIKLEEETQGNADHTLTSIA
jgi:hypothetical protein